MKRILEGLALAAVIFVVGCGKTPVADYRVERFQTIKAKIAQEPAWKTVFQKVLDERHGSVQLKTIDVEDLVVKTLGDEPFVLKDDANLVGVDVKFRMTWDGKIHKNGYTYATFTFDRDWNVTRITPGESDAVIDLRGASGPSVKEARENVGQQLNKVTQKLDEAVQEAKEKWDTEVKPKVDEQIKKADENLQKIGEGLKGLEEQVNAILQSATEDQ